MITGAIHPTRLALALALLFAAERAAAASADDGQPKVQVSVQAHYTSDEVTQGDRTMTDTALLAYRLNACYLVPEWPLAAGLAYGRESRNGGEVGQHVALRLEARWDTVFSALLYGPAGLTYEDRSVAARSGSILAFEVGARGRLPVPWVEVEGSIEWRRTDYDREDGRDLDDPVQRTEVLPLAGMVVRL